MSSADSAGSLTHPGFSCRSCREQIKETIYSHKGSGSSLCEHHFNGLTSDEQQNYQPHRRVAERLQDALPYPLLVARFFCVACAQQPIEGPRYHLMGSDEDLCDRHFRALSSDAQQGFQRYDYQHNHAEWKLRVDTDHVLLTVKKNSLEQNAVREFENQWSSSEADIASSVIIIDKKAISGLTVITGPNNAGKTRLLSYLSGSTPSQHSFLPTKHVIIGVNGNTGVGRFHGEEVAPISQSKMNFFLQPNVLKRYSQLPESHRKTICRLVHRSFQCHLYFVDTEGWKSFYVTPGYTKIQNGDRELQPWQPVSNSPDARHCRKNCYRIDAIGDGMQQLIKVLIVCAFACGEKPLARSDIGPLPRVRRKPPCTERIICLDEPERGLHPPQAFEMGAILCEALREFGIHIAVATHSVDFIKGAIHQYSNSTHSISFQIAHLTPESKTQALHVLRGTDIHQFKAQRPMIVLSQVVQALVHPLTILTENERDAIVYQQGIQLVHCYAAMASNNEDAMDVLGKWLGIVPQRVAHHWRHLKHAFWFATNGKTNLPTYAIFPKKLGCRLAAFVDIDAMDERADRSSSGPAQTLKDQHQRLRNILGMQGFKGKIEDAPSLMLHMAEEAGSKAKAAFTETLLKFAVRTLDPQQRCMHGQTQKPGLGRDTVKRGGILLLPKDSQPDISVVAEGMAACASAGLVVNIFGEMDVLVHDSMVFGSTSKKAHGEGHHEKLLDQVAQLLSNSKRPPMAKLDGKMQRLLLVCKWFMKCIMDPENCASWLETELSSPEGPLKHRKTTKQYKESDERFKDFKNKQDQTTTNWSAPTQFTSADVEHYQSFTSQTTSRDEWKKYCLSHFGASTRKQHKACGKNLKKFISQTSEK